MLSGWRLSVVGIVIVGAAAIIAPLAGMAEFNKTIPLFILFALFVVGLHLLERRKRK
jgi:Sec-independent protein secretion pathway component TatC